MHPLCSCQFLISLISFISLILFSSNALLSLQGTLTFVRIYSGILEAGTYVANPNKGKKERIGRIQLMHANNREDIKVSHFICHRFLCLGFQGQVSNPSSRSSHFTSVVSVINRAL